MFIYRLLLFTGFLNFFLISYSSVILFPILQFLLSIARISFLAFCYGKKILPTKELPTFCSFFPCSLFQSILTAGRILYTRTRRQICQQANWNRRKKVERNVQRNQTVESVVALAPRVFPSPLLRHNSNTFFLSHVTCTQQVRGREVSILYGENEGNATPALHFGFALHQFRISATLWADFQAFKKHREKKNVCIKDKRQNLTACRVTASLTCTN